MIQKWSCLSAVLFLDAVPGYGTRVTRSHVCAPTCAKNTKAGAHQGPGSRATHRGSALEKIVASCLQLASPCVVFAAAEERIPMILPLTKTVSLTIAQGYN